MIRLVWLPQRAYSSNENNIAMSAPATYGNSSFPLSEIVNSICASPNKKSQTCLLTFTKLKLIC